MRTRLPRAIQRFARLLPRRAPGTTFGDALFHALSGIVAVGLLGLIALITLVLTVGAGASISAFGLGFLGAGTWNPRPPEQYGALPFLYGTLVTSAIALLLGVPISLGIAIFLSELAPPWLRVPVTFLVELLAAVPSVVFGLWAFVVLVPFMAGTVEPAVRGALGFLPLFQGPATGLDKLTAGVILAIMITPTISAVSREALTAVPDSQREAALSLGATRWETTRLAVLKYARSGIFGAVVLGLGRAVGETMAVTMTIGNRNVLTASLLDPGQTIASWVANNFTEAGTALELSALIELGLVLMLLAFVINLVARLMVGRVFRIGEATP